MYIIIVYMTVVATKRISINVVVEIIIVTNDLFHVLCMIMQQIHFGEY